MNGILNITKGGTVTNGTAAYVGHFTSSFGTATVGSDTATIPVAWVTTLPLGGLLGYAAFGVLS